MKHYITLEEALENAVSLQQSLTVQMVIVKEENIYYTVAKCIVTEKEEKGIVAELKEVLIQDYMNSRYV